MTYTATIEWICDCGHRNEDQLWTTDSNQCGECYINGEIPKECDLNYIEPCAHCGEYRLSDDNKKDDVGYRTYSLEKLNTDV